MSATAQLAGLYWKKFGPPPMVAWSGPDAELLRLMQRAIERGRALTEDDFYRERDAKPPRALT